jgi:TRAP-type mannitol/chloroaromatic compound transport system permease small subunit
LENLLNKTETGIRWLAFAGTLLIIPLVVSMLTEVIARYVFNSPTLWAYETAYMVTGSFFLLGVAYTLQVGGHVKVDLMTDLLPDRANHIIYVVGYTLSGIFVIWTTVGLTESFLETYHSGETTGESAWNPVFWPFRLVAAFGFALFSIQILIELYRHTLALINGEPFVKKDGLLGEEGT